MEDKQLKKGELITQTCFKLHEFWKACALFSRSRISWSIIEIIDSFNKAIENGSYEVEK